MDQNTNYFPQREKEIDIPDFLESRAKISPDITTEVIDGINAALTRAEEEKTSNMFHLKELDKVADAYTEDEAKIIVKRLVSNYPEIVLNEVASLIKDMQELSVSILKNSKIFATKRGEI